MLSTNSSARVPPTSEPCCKLNCNPAYRPKSMNARTIFYREFKSNLERIERFLAYVDQDVANPKLPDEKDLSVPLREFHFQTWGDELLPWADDEQFAEKITPYEGESLEVDENSKSFEVGIKFTGYPSNSDFLHVQRDGKVTFCRRFPGKDRVDVEEFTVNEETLKFLRIAFKTSKVGSLEAAYFVESNSLLSCELRCTDGSRFRRIQFDDHFPVALRVFVNEVIRLVIDGERPEVSPSASCLSRKPLKSSDDSSRASTIREVCDIAGSRLHFRRLRSGSQQRFSFVGDDGRCDERALAPPPGCGHVCLEPGVSLVPRSTPGYWLKSLRDAKQSKLRQQPKDSLS